MHCDRFVAPVGRGEPLPTRKAIVLAIGGLVGAKRTQNTCSVFCAARASRTVTYKEASHNNKLSSFEMFGTANLKAIIPPRISKS